MRTDAALEKKFSKMSLSTVPLCELYSLVMYYYFDYNGFYNATENINSDIAAISRF